MPVAAARSSNGGRVLWLDALRALALLGVMSNHLVEAFGPGPWFTNPSSDWPDFATRLATFFPTSGTALHRVITSVGWLGDSAPGVFFILSGVALAWRDRNGDDAPEAPARFYTRRLARLFPAYVAAHFVILGLALFIPGATESFRAIAALLSVAGIRAFPQTFFNINPSWWFVGTLIQLYLLYPWLRRAQVAMGDRRFLLAAIGITMVWRAIGLVLLHPGFYLYAWLSGAICVSRLGEFALGMVVANRLDEAGAPRLTVLTIAGSGAALLVAGLAASFTLPTVVVSNLLVSGGLFALGLAFVRALPAGGTAMRALLWIGAASYGAYLLHQPWIDWASRLLPAGLAVPAALGLAALAIVIGAPFEREAMHVVETVRTVDIASRRRLHLLGWLVFIATLVISALIIDPVAQRAEAWWLAVAGTLGVLLLINAMHARSLSALVSAVSLAGASGGALAGGFPTVSIALLLATAVAVVLGLAIARLPGARLPWIVAAEGVAVIATCVLIEQALVRLAPLEAGRWGELPALIEHPTRIYALRPSEHVRLKYNRYQYTVDTDTLGLRVVPDIAPAATGPLVLISGDAFAMGEGVAADSTVAARLETTLKACGIRVVNAAVTGYGPNEEGPELAELIPRLRPTLVLHEFFVNDFEESQLSRDDRLQEIGFLPPRSRNERIRRLQLFAWQEHVRHLVTDDWLQRHGASADDIAFLRYYAKGDRGPYSAAADDSVRRFLARTDSIATANGAKLVVFGVPAGVAAVPRDSLDYLPLTFDPASYDWDRPIRELRALLPAGIPLIDLRPALARPAAGHSPYFRNSWHWSPTGHRVAADTLAGEVVRALGDSLSCLHPSSVAIAR